MSSCPKRLKTDGSVSNSRIGRPNEGCNLFLKESVAGGTKNDLRNPFEMAHVIRNLFLYLGNQELLKCSVVSKMWNYEAKCFLRDLRKCFAHLKVNRKLLRNVDAFYKTFSEPFGGVIAFNGICIKSDDDHDMSRCDDCPGTFIQSYVKLGKDWAVKYIDIIWKDPYCGAQISTRSDYDSSKNFYQCARIIPALLFQHGPTLQELTIRAPYSNRMARYRSIDVLFGRELCNLSLPSLQILRLGHGTEASFCRSRFVQELIHNACPNVQILDVWLLSHNVIRYPSGKLPLFKRFIMRTDDESRGNEILPAACPKLNQLTIYTRASEKLDRIPWVAVNKLLTSSCSSLRELNMDLGTAARLYLHQDNQAPLQHLQYFEIFNVTQKHLKSQNFSECIKATDFSRIFPAVTTIHFKGILEDDQVEANVVEPISAALLGKAGDGSNISCLAFHDFMSIPEQGWNLSSVFPNVHTLYVKEVSDGLHFSLWTAWPGLQNIFLGLHDKIFADWDINDAVFCGIDPEEADNLREMNHADLKRIQIVPLCPPICHLTDLRNFVVIPLNYNANEEEDEEDLAVYPESPYLTSKVAAVMALRRMKTLNARLVIRARERLWTFFETFKGDWGSTMFKAAVSDMIAEGMSLKQLFYSEK